MQNKLKMFIASNNFALMSNLKKTIEKNPSVENIWLSNDGGDAVCEIMRVEPDIVFADMQMPRKNGLQIMEAIYWYPCMKKFPKFVLITEISDTSLYEKARQFEFDFEIIHKPLDIEIIDKCIDEFVPVEIDEEEEERQRQEDLRIFREELERWRLSKENKEEKSGD